MRELLGTERIGLIDVGASGGLEPRWQAIEAHVRRWLFEPDDRAADALVANAHQQVVRAAVSSHAGDLTLHLCRGQQVSSVYEPNRAWLSAFPNPERFDVIDRVKVRATTLDDALAGEGDALDFLKLDAQGHEAAILTGGQRTLPHLLGVEVEVEFQPIYAGQPLFGDVASILSAADLAFVDFLHLQRWERRRFSSAGQLVFGDALFLRTPEWVAEHVADDSKRRRYLAICVLYHRYDWLAVACDKWGLPAALQTTLRAIVARGQRQQQVTATVNRLTHAALRRLLR